MNLLLDQQFGIGHEHVFLGEGHDKTARKTWAVIALCGIMRPSAAFWRPSYIHVIADAAVSVLAIIGLLFAKTLPLVMEQGSTILCFSG